MPLRRLMMVPLVFPFDEFTVSVDVAPASTGVTFLAFQGSCPPCDISQNQLLEYELLRRIPLSLRHATYSAPTSASVGTSSASAVAAASTRVSLYLKNVSANTISIAFSQAAVLNDGITLAPGEWREWTREDCPQDAVFAIASAASSDLAVQQATVAGGISPSY